MTSDFDDKKSRMRELAARRREFKELPDGYAHIEDFHGGAYATKDFVVPYSKAASTLDAAVMLVLQDWNSVNTLQGPLDEHQMITGQSRSFATNTRLRNLLKTHFKLSFCQTYATDVMPFAKPGGRRAPVDSTFMTDCAREFTLKEIDIVKPRLVLCMGRETFRAISHAHDPCRTADDLNVLVLEHGDRSRTTQVIPLRHPQAVITGEVRKKEWNEAAGYLNECANPPAPEREACLLWKRGTCQAQCQP